MKVAGICGIALAVLIVLPPGLAWADRSADDIKDAIDKISTAGQNPVTNSNCEGISLLNVCSGAAGTGPRPPSPQPQPAKPSQGQGTTAKPQGTGRQ